MPARRWGEEIHLELDAENRRPRLHQTERGVAAGAVDRRGDYPGVEESVLLREIFAKIEPQLDFTRNDTHDGHAERLHGRLFREARANAFLE